MLAFQPALDMGKEATQNDLGDGRQRGTRRFPVVLAKEDVHADLEFLGLRPAPRCIQRVLQVIGLLQRPRKLRFEFSRRCQLLEEGGGEHGVEQADMVAEIVG